MSNDCSNTKKCKNFCLLNYNEVAKQKNYVIDKEKIVGEKEDTNTKLIINLVNCENDKINLNNTNVTINNNLKTEISKLTAINSQNSRDKQEDYNKCMKQIGSCNSNCEIEKNDLRNSHQKIMDLNSKTISDLQKTIIDKDSLLKSENIRMTALCNIQIDKITKN
jgi:hypothetical protein